MLAVTMSQFSILAHGVFECDASVLDVEPDLPWSSLRFLPRRFCEVILQTQQRDNSAVFRSSVKGHRVPGGRPRGCRWDPVCQSSSGTLTALQMSLTTRETKNGETLVGWAADVQGVAVVVDPSEGEVGLEEVYPASGTSQVRTREVRTRGKNVI